jgi:hypothetical protein
MPKKGQKGDQGSIYKDIFYRVILADLGLTNKKKKIVRLQKPKFY